MNGLNEIMKNKILQAKCCSNCKFYIIQDLSAWRYETRAVCKKNIFRTQDFTGDGDYAENVMDKQVCNLFRYKK